ncbi:MAG TPA: hypothetical protein VIN08_15100 [Ohtaekwangia sp.]|uniref:hypothetical protein n=1 Tax=Ohtaekwangia sp. TaxID=2066019 RepID=UPI002F95767E
MIMRLASILVLTLVSFVAAAQNFESAVEYMDFFSSRSQQLSENYLSYMSEFAHGKRARKLEKRRSELIASIRKALNDATRVKPFKGDATLRDAYKRYWDIELKVFNEDYHKIVDMEEIAEQSYDAMEAYLLAQDKASEVLALAQDQISPILKAFAISNKINLVDGGDSKMSKKLQQVSAVSIYHRQVYLIFFKTYKQEGYATEAWNKKDINSLEQNRTTLIRFVDEGLARLDTMRAFQGDGSLVTACRKMLEFQKSEGEKDIPLQREFLVKSNEFEKIKKAFDSKPADQRTSADVDQYNKAVNEMNASINASNKSLQSMSANQAKLLNNWNDTEKRFLDSHVPH